MDNGLYKQAVEFTVHRTYGAIAKRLLMLIEDLHFDHNNAFDKLYENMPDKGEVLDSADYFDDQKFAHCRKRILDIVGDSRREMMDEVAKYTLSLNRN